jgi:hypothetical protein
MGNRHVYKGDGKEVSPPQTALDVKNLMADAMAEIRAGKMDPKLGTTLGYLGTSLLRPSRPQTLNSDWNDWRLQVNLKTRISRLEAGLATEGKFGAAGLEKGVSSAYTVRTRPRKQNLAAASAISKLQSRKCG